MLPLGRPLDGQDGMDEAIRRQQRREQAKRRRGRARLAQYAAAAAIVFLALLAVAVPLTDRPEFCAGCHEIRPSVESWRGGAHANAGCADCHSPRGAGRLIHKVASIRELVVHVSDGKVTRRAVVTDSRCRDCHRSIAEGKGSSAFSHTTHSKTGSCVSCHATAGHGAAVSPRGGRNLPRHTRVACAGCHDMRTEECSKCHAAPKRHYAPQCSACHQPGRPFARALADHPRFGPHTRKSFACASCHAKGFAQASCAKCHQGDCHPEDVDTPSVCLGCHTR